MNDTIQGFVTVAVALLAPRVEAMQSAPAAAMAVAPFEALAGSTARSEDPLLRGLLGEWMVSCNAGGEESAGSAIAERNSSNAFIELRFLTTGTGWNYAAFLVGFDPDKGDYAASWWDTANGTSPACGRGQRRADSIEFTLRDETRTLLVTLAHDPSTTTWTLRKESRDAAGSVEPLAVFTLRRPEPGEIFVPPHESMLITLRSRDGSLDITFGHRPVKDMDEARGLLRDACSDWRRIGKQVPLEIRADSSVPWSGIAPLMESARELGIERIVVDGGPVSAGASPEATEPPR